MMYSGTSLPGILTVHTKHIIRKDTSAPEGLYPTPGAVPGPDASASTDTPHGGAGEHWEGDGPNETPP